MKPDFQLYTLEEAKAKGLPYEKQEERVCVVGEARRPPRR